jgi:hypothetical protein
VRAPVVVGPQPCATSLPVAVIVENTTDARGDLCAAVARTTVHVDSTFGIQVTLRNVATDKPG